MLGLYRTKTYCLLYDHKWAETAPYKICISFCISRLDEISYFFSLQSDIVAIATVSQTFGIQPLSETSYFTEVASYRPTGFLRNSKH